MGNPELEKVIDLPGRVVANGRRPLSLKEKGKRSEPETPATGDAKRQGFAQPVLLPSEEKKDLLKELSCLEGKQTDEGSLLEDGDHAMHAAGEGKYVQQKFQEEAEADPLVQDAPVILKYGDYFIYEDEREEYAGDWYVAMYVGDDEEDEGFIKARTLVLSTNWVRRSEPRPREARWVYQWMQTRGDKRNRYTSFEHGPDTRPRTGKGLVPEIIYLPHGDVLGQVTMTTNGMLTVKAWDKVIQLGTLDPNDIGGLRRRRRELRKTNKKGGRRS